MSDRRGALLLCLAAAAALLAFYVSIYPIKGFRVAIGSDTPVYAFWARYAGTAGLGALGIGRPATVGTLAGMSRLLDQPASAVAASIAPAMAVAVALALGALVRSALGADRLLFAMATALTGAFLSILVGGYLSTLAFGSAFVAALACMSEGLRRPGARPMTAAAVLLGAAGLAHPAFLVLAAVLIGGGLVALFPAMRRDVASGASPTATGFARLALASAGGGALALAGVGLTALAPTDGVRLSVDTSRDAVLRRAGMGSALADSYRRKLLHDFPWHRALVFGGLAATPLLAPRRQRSSFFWGVMLAWLAVTVLAVVALLAGMRVPGQRMAIFCLAVPALVGIGLHALRQRLGPILLVGGAIAFLFVAWLGWADQRPVVTVDALRQVGLAGRQLVGTPPGTPLVLIGDIRAEKPGFLVVRYANYLRAAVPADRVPDACVFPGSVEDYLAGRPTLTGNREHDVLARSAWEEIRRTGRTPVAVALEAFDQASYRAAAGTPGATNLGPGVVSLPGPVESTSTMASFGIPDERPISPWTPVWLAPLLLALAALVGWPWAAVALTGSDSLTRTALAPAFGLASLGLASVAVDAVGIRLGGSGGIAAPVLAFVLGLLALAWARARSS